jgi:uncharacterized protein
MAGMTVLVWAGTDAWRAESAEVHQVGDGFTARGVQLGVDPLPYRVDHRLETTGGWLTRTLEVSATGDGWRRTLLLTSDLEGAWTCEATAHGDVDLPGPGGQAATLTGALDCDLGLSPLTNTMPVLRHRLHRGGGAAELLVAWVSVPDLQVHASRQRYQHARTTASGAVIRFTSGDFTADVVVDGDGFVVDYPGLAERLSP